MKKLSKQKLNKIKKINKEIFDHVISLIVFTLLLVVLTVIITLNYLHKNVQTVYIDKGFMVQINPKIKKDLESLTDSEGLNSKYNTINITNNNNEMKKYQLILTPLNNDEENIRVLLDNSLLRVLSKFRKEDDHYILGEYSLEKSNTIIHTIRMWKDKKDENKKINVNFNLSVKVLD